MGWARAYVNGKTKKGVHYWNLCDSCDSRKDSMVLNQDIEEACVFTQANGKSNQRSFFANWLLVLSEREDGGDE